MNKTDTFHETSDLKNPHTSCCECLQLNLFCILIETTLNNNLFTAMSQWLCDCQNDACEACKCLYGRPTYVECYGGWMSYRAHNPWYRRVRI